MSHQDIIQTLIEWIDEHIDQPLNIDIVARKSGYSKWYLQRMFRTVMHQTLGDYIRQRRLLLAVVGKDNVRSSVSQLKCGVFTEPTTTTSH